MAIQIAPLASVAHENNLLRNSLSNKKFEVDLNMDSTRKTGIIVGVLFITASVAGILSAVFSGTLMDDENYLIEIAANDVQMSTGALFLVIMAVAIALIPVAAFSILRLYNESLALTYVVLRSLEAVMFLVLAAVMGILLLISDRFVAASGVDDAFSSNLGTLLLDAVDVITPISIIVFTLSALILNYMLFRARLVPTWLAIWGLIGAAVYLVSGVIGVFDSSHTSSTVGVLFAAPIGLAEMALAIWLIAKGFSRKSRVLSS